MQVAEYAYTRLRSEFGRQCNFSDRSTEIHADIPPDEELSGLFIPRDPVDRSVQTSCCDFSEHYVNTPFAELVATGVNHTEGGWPKDVSCTDIEQTTRHRKKLEKDDAYQLQFLAESKLIEHTILQNNAVDIYNDFFSDCDILSTTDNGQPTIKVVNTFKDPNDIKRAVTSISWHPEGPDRVAVAHCIMRFQEHTPETSLENYVYKTDDLSRPESRLVSNFPTCSIRYSPKDVNTIVGGQNNGQVSVWDVRRGKLAVERSTLQFSHNDPVYKVIWVQSKTNTEFFTTSTDGQVMWWDMRKIAEPIDQMWIDPTKKNEKGPAEGGLCLDFESSMPTKFMVGSERGVAYVCTRKAKSPSERISLAFQCHYGPIYAIQRNPTYPKHFLTIGDWTAKIFSEDVRDSPIWWTAPAMQYPSDARWSATRPSVFYVSKMDGSLDVWDLLFRQKSPVLNVMVSDDSLMTLEMEEQGQLMAVGSEGGCLTILEISANLAELQNNEKALFLSMLEREARREKILEGRAREKKLAAKVLETGGEVEKLSLHAEVEAAIAEAELNFRDMISKERKRMERESETLRVESDEAADRVRLDNAGMGSDMLQYLRVEKRS